MDDLIWLAAGLAFFAAAFGLIYFFGSLRPEDKS